MPKLKTRSAFKLRFRTTASGKILNEYGRFPCKIQCAVYAFMVKGNARATLNITRFEIKENDLITLRYGSLHHFSLSLQRSSNGLVFILIIGSLAFCEKSTPLKSGTLEIR